MLIGSLLLIGLISLFGTTSNVNRMENGLARLQENGRYALDRVVADLRMASAMRGMRKSSEGGGPGSSNPDRPMVSLVDMGDGADRQATGLPAAPTIVGTSRYHIPPSYFLRGHDCLGVNCTPAVGGAGSDVHAPMIPPIGTEAGARAGGADVLTMRYLRGVGVPLNPDTSVPAGPANGAVIQLDQALNVGASGLVVIGDHSTSMLMSVNAGTGGMQLTGANNLAGAMLGSGFLPDDGVRVSDFDSDFVTVSYYLRLEQDPSRSDRLISVLRRRENGNDVAIAEGIERLDFLYHVEDRQGRMMPMTGAQVDSMTSAQCPRASINPELVSPIRDWDAANCGWRSVRAVEIYLLATTVDDVGSHQEAFRYGFLPDGSRDIAGSTDQLACDLRYGECPGGSMVALPSGLPPGRMLRREFRTTVAVRNNSY